LIKFRENWNKQVVIYNALMSTDLWVLFAVTLLPTTYKILSNSLLSGLLPYAQYINGDMWYGFPQILIKYFTFIRLKELWEYSRAANQLFVDFKKARDSIRSEIFYNIITEYGILMKLVRPVKCIWTKPTLKFAQTKSVWCISYSERSEIRCFVAIAFKRY